MRHVQDARASDFARLTRLLLFALGLGMLFWLLQSFAMAYIFHEGELIAQILTPSPLGIWVRMLVLGFLIGFAFHANRLLGKRERAEKELRESQERYRQLVELSPDGIAVQSEDKIVFINSAGAKLFGAEVPEQLVGRSVWDFVPPDHRGVVAERYRQMRIEGKRAPLIEQEFIRLDGTHVCTEVAATPFAFEGKPAIQAIFRDVTERKRAESELVRLRKAVETSGEAIFLADREGVITFVNPEFTRLYGYAAEEVIGRATPRVLKSGKMTQQEYEWFWARLLDQQIVKGEFINRGKDGRLIPVEGSANPILDENENIVGFLAIQRDITARKLAEEEIRQRNKELAALNAIAATVSGSLDLNQILHDALDEVLRLKILGEEAYGMLFLLDEASQTLNLAAQRGAPEGHPCLVTSPKVGECLCGLAIQQGEVIVSENSLEDERHTRRWPEMFRHQDICVPLTARGQKLGVMEIRLPETCGIADSDVRLLKAIADQVGVAIENTRLRELRERAIVEERERIARELHDGMAQHLGYINTKVAAIGLLLDSRKIKAAKENLLNLEEATQRLFADLREAILDLKMSGQLAAGLIPTIEDYAARFSRLSNLSVEVAIAPQIEPLHLTAETEVQILRIIQEALTNVRKHASARSARVSLQFSGDALELIVSDDGEGFGPTAPQRDHRPHFGLSIMRERADAIGGVLTVDSAPGEGTRIIVSLPLRGVLI